jgi:hypothetical protein
VPAGRAIERRRRLPPVPVIVPTALRAQLPPAGGDGEHHRHRVIPEKLN